MKRKRYTEEFKKEAVKQVVERGYTQKEVAENLGVSQPSLFRWIKEYGGDRPHGNTKHTDEDKDAEIARLKAKLKQTEEERDILKKAAVYFANQPE